MKKDKHFLYDIDKDLYIQKGFSGTVDDCMATDGLSKNIFDPSKIRIFNTFEISQFIRYIVALNWMRFCMQKMKKEILPTQQFYIGDFGCSHSQLYRYWKNNCNFFGRPHIDYCGYDASEKRINDGRKTLTPRKGDALNYFLVDLSSKFTAQYYHDIIVCMETIEHLPKEKVPILLKNIYRALPSHGYAILSSPNPLKEKGELWAWGDSPKRDHVYEWSFDEIQKPLARAGLKIIAKCGIGPRDIFRTNILHTKQRKRLQKYLPYSIVGNVLCLRDINQCRQWMVLLQKEF